MRSRWYREGSVRYGPGFNAAEDAWEVRALPSHGVSSWLSLDAQELDASTPVCIASICNMHGDD